MPATAWEGDHKLVTGMMPGRCLKRTPILCLDKDIQVLSWAATSIRPRHPGHMVMRPNTEGLTDGGSNNVGNEQGMAWARISAFELPGFPEWVMVPFHLPSGLSRSLVIHTVHSAHSGLSLWEQTLMSLAPGVQKWND